MKVYSKYAGTMAPRVFYMFLQGRRECFEIFRLMGMFFLLAMVLSPLDEVNFVKSTWADKSAVCAINRHLPGLSSRKRINVGQQDGASAPTPTRGGHER